MIAAIMPAITYQILFGSFFGDDIWYCFFEYHTLSSPRLSVLIVQCIESCICITESIFLFFGLVTEQDMNTIRITMYFTGCHLLLLSSVLHLGYTDLFHEHRWQNPALSSPRYH